MVKDTVFFLMIRRPPRSTLFPCKALFRSKEALQKSTDENITQGRVINLNSQDCLVYNLEKNKLITTVGLNGTVVVNTPDALIVVPKDKVRQVTDLVKKIVSEGLEKYL